MNIFIKTKYVVVAFITLCLVSCQKHEEVLDYSLQVGYIYCEDGRVIPPAVYDESVHNAIAVILKIGNENDSYKAIAVGFDEWDEQTSSKALAFPGVGSGRDDMNGWANTAAMITVADNNKEDLRCPAANSISNYYKGDGRWYIPACGELLELAKKKKIINASFVMTGATLLSNKWYLSSSQDGTNENTKVLYMLNVSLTEGRIMSSEKTSLKTIRPFILIQ